MIVYVILFKFVQIWHFYRGMSMSLLFPDTDVCEISLEKIQAVAQKVAKNF